MTHTATEPNSQEKSAHWADFVVLAENNSAHLAIRRLFRSLTDTTNRYRTPNPLVLHGSTGCGKSFLAQTLVRQLMAAPLGHTIQVVFAGEIVRNTEDQSPGDELADARTADLLVIEDLQQLPLRSSSIFSELLDDRLRRRLPTVLTCSVGPAGLKAMPRRLSSRLAGGLVVQIEPLRVRSRERLLTELASRRGLSLETEAIEWMARRAQGGGIRPLVGMLEQLRTLTRSHPRVWNLFEVQQALQDEAIPQKHPVERIVQKVATAYGVKPKDLLGSCRQRTVLLPRQVAMFLAREVTKLSLVSIGTAFGGRDHTTVMHACKKITELMKTDAKLRRTIRDLRTECR
jgi:chromosomal replication initiator protein